MRDQELVNKLRTHLEVTRKIGLYPGKSGIWAVIEQATDRIANQSTHIAALQQEIEKLRGQNEQLREAAVLVAKESAELLERRWIPVTERLRRIVAMSLLSRIGTKDGAPIWAGALPKGRHGLSMSALGTDPISPSRTGCRCRNRRR